MLLLLLLLCGLAAGGRPVATRSHKGSKLTAARLPVANSTSSSSSSVLHPASALPTGVLGVDDYWNRLVGAPSRLGGRTTKEGVLPTERYDFLEYDVTPFQAWLRHNSLVAAGSSAASVQLGSRSGTGLGAAGDAGRPPRPSPPLSYICGVYINHQYKFIFIRNRKTASSSFLTGIRNFLQSKGMCQSSSEDDCIGRMDPEALRADGRDPAQLWRDYLVITSSRNAWARAASGYEFVWSQWHRHMAGCEQPTFEQFCQDPFLLGKVSNLFSCASRRPASTGKVDDHWNFDFYHVEPAQQCMVDGAGRLVVDYVIRYERLEEDLDGALQLINLRRPQGMPPIVIQALGWKKMGEAAKKLEVRHSREAAYVYARHFRECGAACVDGISSFFWQDLKLFGWDRPGPPPQAS